MITADFFSDVLTPEDRDVIDRAGYGGRRGLGRMPALLIVDCQYNHIGGDRPTAEQLDEFPAGAGAGGWSVVRAARALREAAWKAGAPVLYTRYCYDEAAADHDFFRWKRGHWERFVDGSPGTRIVAELEPGPRDIVLKKGASSPFVDTPILRCLVGAGVDTIVLCGVSTSGCVRATCVDAASYGFRPAVVVDAVADRIAISHRAALLDIWMKYGDLLRTAEAVDYLDQARSAAPGRPDASPRQGAHNKGGHMKTRALVLSPGDNVATLIRAVQRGGECQLEGSATGTLRVLEDVPFGHKVALVDIPCGGDVVKYGQVIGRAVQDVRAGALVHVHNAESRRGRGDLKPQAVAAQ